MPLPGRLKMLNSIWRDMRWSILAGCAAILLTLWLAQTDFVERWELRTQDSRLFMRGPRSTRAKIVIVEVTDSTLKAWPEPQVFWGTRFADLLHHARTAGQHGSVWILFRLSQPMIIWQPQEPLRAIDRIAISRRRYKRPAAT